MEVLRRMDSGIGYKGEIQAVAAQQIMKMIRCAVDIVDISTDIVGQGNRDSGWSSGMESR